MTKIFAICVLSIMGAVFVFGIAGYFIFLSRVKTKKTAIKLKERRMVGLLLGGMACSRLP